LAKELAEPKDHPGVATAKQHGEQPVGQRAADDAVTVTSATTTWIANVLSSAVTTIVPVGPDT